jgi:hypothetical protein
MTVTGLRWLLLAIGIVQLLAGTVLFATIRRRMIDPMFAFAEQNGRPLPSILRAIYSSRITPLALAVIPLGLWWYLGTPAGAEAFSMLGPRR